MSDEPVFAEVDDAVRCTECKEPTCAGCMNADEGICGDCCEYAGVPRQPPRPKGDRDEW